MLTTITSHIESESDWKSSPAGLWLLASLVGSALALGVFVGQNSWVPVAAVLIAPFILLWPVQFGLGLFALLVPFDSVSAIGHAGSGMTLTFVAGGAAILILVIVGLVSNRLVVPHPAAQWWALLVAWAFTGSYWAMNSGLVFERMPTVLALVILYLVASSVHLKPSEFASVITFTIVGGVTAAFITIVQFYSGVLYEDSMRGSLIIGSRQSDPNFFAAALLLPISLSIGRLLSSRSSLRKTLWTAVVLLMGFGVFVTISRGAVVALGVMVTIYLYQRRTDWRIVVPACLLILLLAVVPNLFFSRFHEMGGPKSSARMDFWHVGVAAFWHHGIFGVGLNNFPLAYDAYVRYSPSFHGYHRMAHNVYISTLIETGMIGFLLFAGGLRAHLRWLWSGERRSAALRLPFQAALCAVLVSGFFLDILWTKSFWLVLILATIAERTSQRQLHSQGQTAGFAPYS